MCPFFRSSLHRHPSRHRILDSGITAFMEIGLDPGIDHLLAMECFDEIREHAGTITMYKSYTGGLPAPEFSDNPLRYKFSWSPEAALSTALNGAKYLKNGHVSVRIPRHATTSFQAAKRLNKLCATLKMLLAERNESTVSKTIARPATL
ncbi:unnamed protein product [Protopolystoma xenopodis]|uniref:Saccharopine dehydrogenase-like C-terminal domain-containing protein n=1 Tax=Protopolystoma xenopodis TaxID=117903 RepID=A0A448XSA5_9PLAT|nr:unnamed protein product [Protopolystoma xenopodis]